MPTCADYVPSYIRKLINDGAASRVRRSQGYFAWGLGCWKVQVRSTSWLAMVAVGSHMQIGMITDEVDLK
jgi:hypothetical protein